MAKTKLPKLSTIRNRLDRLFSKYIRLRDADENGLCECCSCGKIDHWTECDAGHYINRAKLWTRYDKQNVHAQCRYCNRYDEGNVAGYTLFLQRKYGQDIIETLHERKNAPDNRTPVERKEWLLAIEEEIKAELSGLDGGITP